ncbi:hypothetical protein DSM3645_08176 [Blastopirellula marina DSM 3645]|uniref:Uncharacterized protein n=1 Tax=Blastopirellula marina DSM 3645 TaxID=314230 RepID=A4A0Z4_9BACT|nr:hypothetical protein DSM3645_08176 [Blastopirellula marina DSM 3645]
MGCQRLSLWCDRRAICTNKSTSRRTEYRLAAHCNVHRWTFDEILERFLDTVEMLEKSGAKIFCG